MVNYSIILLLFSMVIFNVQCFDDGSAYQYHHQYPQPVDLYLDNPYESSAIVFRDFEPVDSELDASDPGEEAEAAPENIAEPDIDDEKSKILKGKPMNNHNKHRNIDDTNNGVIVLIAKPFNSGSSSSSSSLSPSVLMQSKQQSEQSNEKDGKSVQFLPGNQYRQKDISNYYNNLYKYYWSSSLVPPPPATSTKNTDVLQQELQQPNHHSKFARFKFLNFRKRFFPFRR